MSRRTALYATNVFHYRHVLAALSAVADEVTLAARFEVTPSTVRRAARLGVPARGVRLLERRSVEPVEEVSRVGIGAAQFMLPLMARVDALHTLRMIRVSIDGQSRAVARRLDGQQLFQFVEGLGHRTLEKGYDGIAICERRHFHHEVLEGDPGVVGDFPFHFRPDPIGDFLDHEYERADLICVYSDVARASFLDRGFDPSRVVVTPLGFPPMDFTPLGRPRRSHLVAYVGRCDAFKGIDVAVAALEELGSPYELHVAGPASDEVRSWLDTKPRVTYLGILDRTELAELYSDATVLIAPSIESFGYAALEGAGFGARLVCSDQTGAREFLPAHTHRVVIGRDPAVWAAAVTEAVAAEPPDLDAVHRALVDLSWDRSGERMTKTLQDLLRRHGVSAMTHRGAQ